MATSYNFILKNRDGTVQYSLGGYSSASWGRGLNSIGALTLEMPKETFPLSVADAIDCRIEIWRKVVGSTDAYLDGKTCYFIRRVEEKISKEGANVLKITAYDAISLLARHIVAYDTDSLEGTKWDTTDDMMKEIVRENFTADASNADRDLSAYFEVEDDELKGPIIFIEIGWQNVLKVLKKIAEASYQEALGGEIGEQYLFFDVEYSPNSAKPFCFRTYIDQTGKDRTVNGETPLTVRAPSANIPVATKIYDYASEANVVYALGQDYGSATETTVAEDANRASLSPFNRQEISVKGKNTEDIEELQTQANESLQRNRPKIYFEAEMLDSQEVIFGRDYNYGDRIMVNVAGTVFETLISAYQIELRGGVEKVTVKLRGEEYVLH